MNAKDEKNAEAQKVNGGTPYKKDKEKEKGGDDDGDDPKKPKRSMTQKLIGALSTKDSEPAGGLDKTPVPPASSGYTIRFTFHKCTNLPAADLATVSSDPYFMATLTSLGIQPRHTCCHSGSVDFLIVRDRRRRSGSSLWRGWMPRDVRVAMK